MQFVQAVLFVHGTLQAHVMKECDMFRLPQPMCADQDDIPLTIRGKLYLKRDALEVLANALLGQVYTDAVASWEPASVSQDSHQKNPDIWTKRHKMPSCVTATVTHCKEVHTITVQVDVSKQTMILYMLPVSIVTDSACASTQGVS